MKVTLYNQQRDLPISAHSVERLISFLLKPLKIANDEIVIHFVSEKRIQKIHQEFFNDPTSTDCISFPIDPPNPQRTSYSILGEVFICPKVAIQYGCKHRVDPYEETTRYLIHGLLHLLGYDDIRPDERMKMRAKESRCLKKLKIHRLLLE